MSSTKNNSSTATKAGACLVGLLVFASIIIILTRLAGGGAFDSNILSLIPVDAGSASRASANQKLQYLTERRISILVSADDKEHATQFALQLRDDLMPSVLQPTAQAFDTFERLKDLYKPFRYQLLTSRQRAFYSSNEAGAIAQGVLEKLYSPFAGLQTYPFAEDPFALGSAWFQGFASDQHVFGDELPELRDANGKTWVVLNAEIKGEPFDLDVQQAVLQSIHNASTSSNAPVGLELMSSGMLFHAAEGARLANAEISTLGLFSVFAIAILVLSIFRSARILLLMLMLLTASSMVALAACMLLFESVHLITLAFGASLLGIAVDYAFHYLCLYRTGKGRFVVSRSIRAGVLLSMFSTLLAYAMQFASPFPGLHQFAVFIIAGLLSAGLLVLYVLPYALPDKNARQHLPENQQLTIFHQYFLPACRSLASHRSLVIVVLVVVALAAILRLFQIGGNDDIRTLNTSSSELMATEAKVADLLKRSAGQQYFIFEGDVQQRLQNAETVFARLTADVSSDSDQPMAYSLAALVPSLEQQRADYELLREKLFGSEGASAILCMRAKILCSLASNPPSFNSDLKPDSIPHVLIERLKLDVVHSKGFDLMIVQGQIDREQFSRLSEGLVDVEGIDRVVELSELLQRLRVNIAWIVAGFIAVLGLLGVFVFGMRSIVLLAPLLVSVLLALSLASGMGVSLFHLLAVLLVMGLTIDAAIFYLKLGLNQEVWLAVSMSSLTSMLAFGLLSYSAVPVLAHFGKVVFIGLLSSWLLIPLVYCLLDTINYSGRELYGKK